VDAEDGRPGAVGQDERPAALQVVVAEEPHPAVGEVALPLLVMEDLDEVQGLAATALLHHDARRGVPRHYADKAGRERQALLAPGPQVHHGGGEPMLWGVGEPLLWRRAPGLARLDGGRTVLEGPPTFLPAKPGGRLRTPSRRQRGRPLPLGESRQGQRWRLRPRGPRCWRQPRQPPLRGPWRRRRREPPRKTPWRPQLQAPPRSSCCGCPGGGRASKEPVASPPGPSPCSSSRTCGHACAHLTHWGLRPRLR
jgi:hypothetical protein